MEKRKDKRMSIEKPSCWRLFGLLGWTTGFGGFLLIAVEGLMIYKPEISINLSKWVLLVIGISSLSLSIVCVFIRPQWTVNLMELRSLKKRVDSFPSNNDFVVLSETIVSFMTTMKTMSEDITKRENYYQREIHDTLLSLQSSLSKLESLQKINDKLNVQEVAIREISESLKQTEASPSKKTKSSNKEKKDAIQEEIKEENDRLMYV
ncbi:MAG: hypothetical protein ACI4SL_02490 [Candidatus Ornithospirochaeta sp.]